MRHEKHKRRPMNQKSVQKEANKPKPAPLQVSGNWSQPMQCFKDTEFKKYMYFFPQYT